jgi:stage V sporulation protein R
MNEGFASYIHAELMYRFDDISSEDHLEFCKIHEKVVQPGTNKLNINPYFLGFTIFNDIKKRWDKEYEDGESEITGLQKIYEVVESEDDVSFVKNYLTQELVDELKMFAYKRSFDKSRNEFIEIESTDKDDVAEHVVSNLYNYMSPEVYIENASSDGIELVHSSSDSSTLDERHLEKVMGYIYELWGGLVNISTKDVNGEEVNYTYDELGFSHISEDDLTSPLFTGMD